MKTACLIVILGMLACLSPAQGADNLKAFPPADEGMVRHILQLPTQEDEAAFQVELIVEQG